MRAIIHLLNTKDILKEEGEICSSCNINTRTEHLINICVIQKLSVQQQVAVTV